MRGTPPRLLREPRRRRIIPAHAGNSRDTHGRLVRRADHPRACGELGVRKGKDDVEDGSSPRMRGTLYEVLNSFRVHRIIPAHAGNSGCGCSDAGPRPDHPRACGELLCRDDEARMASGSSPRMRGTPGGVKLVTCRYRIIPAHAGNSLRAPVASASGSDHPRACGELDWPGAQDLADTGSSPRMRGTQRGSMPRSVLHRIIPAHAGNSRRSRGETGSRPDHPRACGELSASTSSIDSFTGSSPRMRGTRSSRSHARSKGRIIPAHAGNS